MEKLDNYYEELESIERLFDKASREYSKTCGYIEGCLETMISMLLEQVPEISVTADRLVKSFRTVEGIHSSGLSKAYTDLRKQHEEVLSQLSVAYSNLVKAEGELEFYTKKLNEDPVEPKIAPSMNLDLIKTIAKAKDKEKEKT